MTVDCRRIEFAEFSACFCIICLFVFFCFFFYFGGGGGGRDVCMGV